MTTTKRPYAQPTPCFKEGDLVSVLLPGGEYRGLVTDLLHGYNWSDDLYLRVTGNTPRVFETICLASNVTNLEEDQ